MRFSLPLTAVPHLMPAQTGVTPLNIAADNGHLAVVKELLSHGASTSRADKVNELTFTFSTGHALLVQDCPVDPQTLLVLIFVVLATE